MPGGKDGPCINMQRVCVCVCVCVCLSSPSSVGIFIPAASLPGDMFRSPPLRPTWLSLQMISH